MTKPSKRRRPKKRRPDFFQKNKVLLLLLGVAGLLVVSLVLLARRAEPPPPPPPAPVPPPVVAPQVDYTKMLHAEVEALLATLEVEPDQIQRDLDHKPARYAVEAEYPSAELIAGFQERVARIPGDYVTRWRAASSLTIEKDRLTLIIIQFAPPAPVMPDGPLVTIIMDDLGRSTSTAKALVSIPQLVTFAILPDEPQAVRVAEIAHAAGREVMLHIPMEPQGFPAVNPGSDALFIKYSDAEIRSRFDQHLAKIPHVTGANNHMGSRFTEDARALKPVMESLQEKGLFFIDSRTTGRSRVSEVAHQVGVPSLDRDVFLDNVAEVDAIILEIRRLESRARKQGMAIGICHPYPETLEALKRELPGLAARGLTIVPVSALLVKRAQGS